MADRRQGRKQKSTCGTRRTANAGGAARISLGASLSQLLLFSPVCAPSTLIPRPLPITITTHNPLICTTTCTAPFDSARVSLEARIRDQVSRASPWMSMPFRDVLVCTLRLPMRHQTNRNDCSSTLSAQGGALKLEGLAACGQRPCHKVRSETGECTVCLYCTHFHHSAAIQYLD